MNQAANIETARKLGLTDAEYDKIESLLHRKPNFTELCMFASMWSEHCSYKNSLKYLKTLPRKSAQILNETSTENAGIVDIGGDYACVFKMESHNHPSAIEPFQGAATGVGGINRDIFTMGARPFAQLISLRFGPLTDTSKKNLRLLNGVVKGISHYGNSFGVAIVDGDIFFDETYQHNPLVNVLSAGIVKKTEILHARAKGEGNPVYIAGSATGKDGINGAVFASANITSQSESQIPSIQIGDPFAGKILMEACLEAAKTKELIAIQDMGAAGILCASSEMSANGKCGMKIQLDKVPLQQKNMSPEEIFLSESQERMMIILEKGKEKGVENIFKKWNVPLVKIGEVTAENSLQYYYNNTCIAQLSPSFLVAGEGAPVYEREYTKPTYLSEIAKFNIHHIPLPADLNNIGDFLISHPDIASKKHVFEQFDSMIGTANMNTHANYNASLLKIKENGKTLALCVSGNAKYVYADPEKGAMIAVAEAALKIVCSGAKPLSITNCLNFGNPYDKEVYWQFVHTIKGITHACNIFNTPVSGGNVSFYNQSEINGKNTAVLPTPVIGMLGIIEDNHKPISIDFQSANDLIYILGKTENDISSSVYTHDYLQIRHSPAPAFNIEDELALIKCIHECNKNNFIRSAQRISLGGIYIALLKSCFKNQFGFQIKTDPQIRKDAFLFGETQGRILISVSPDNEHHFTNLCINHNIFYHKAGLITNDKQIHIDQTTFGNMDEKFIKYSTSSKSV